jgi:glyoxylase-like metal-dependent hydrolase (beta-lactamase superfamily II)
MIIHRTTHPSWLSNSWLVADREGGNAVVIDTGGPMAPLVRGIAELRLTLTHVLCTHHHQDHIAHNRDYRRRYGCAVCGHARERELFGGLDRELAGGEELWSGGLHIRALHIPGHTAGQLAFAINEERVFTGDTLFSGSVGGTRAPGHTTLDDLRHSIMEILMALPQDISVHPGHGEPTTIGREWAENPFVRLWRGLEQPRPRPCSAFGQPAELLLAALDYDGGRKCLVRFDSGQLDVVPGSRVVEHG